MEDSRWKIQDEKRLEGLKIGKLKRKFKMKYSKWREMEIQNSK